MLRKLSRTFIFLLFSSMLLLQSAPSLRAAVPDPRLKAAYNVIWAENLKLQLSFLCDDICQGRATGSRGNVEAGFWIASEFARLGLLPLDGDGVCCGTSYARHCQLDKGGFGHNFVAMLPGSAKYHKKDYIIVAAHYDGIGTIGGKLYPGADSNASGTVSLLSIAKMFTTMRLFGKSWSSNILFVAFDAKELSMGGSNAFWKALEDGHLVDPVSGKAISPSQIRLMVNIDQVGGVSEPLHRGRKDYLIMLGNDSLPKSRRELASYVNRNGDLGLDLGFDYYGSARFTELFYRLSDQRVFVDHKCPAILFTSGITMTTNKVSDTPDTIDFDVLRKRIMYIFTWIEKVIEP